MQDLCRIPSHDHDLAAAPDRRHRFLNLGAVMCLCLVVGVGVGRRVAADDAVTAVTQDRTDDRRMVLPSTVDRALRAEIEGAATSADLENVLLRHPDQGPLIVPRLEAIGAAEIRRDGPGARFVINEIEPDDGPASSVSVEAGTGGVKLTQEFPGDVPSAAFTDGSVHRFVGSVPFADLLTLYGDGDKNHRLTFTIVADYGMVYLRGSGRVMVQRGGSPQTIQLGTQR
jgi:hypothetical protein